MPPYVFPGSTPFIESAAAELGVEVRTHDVQKIAAVRNLSILAAQAADHPNPADLIEAAKPHLATLAVADLAARAMIDDVAEVADPSAARARADAFAKRRADADARAEAEAQDVADLKAAREQLAARLAEATAKIEAQATANRDLEARLKVAEGVASAVPQAPSEPDPKAAEAPAEPEAKARPKK